METSVANVNFTYYICVHLSKNGSKFRLLINRLLITKNERRFLLQLKSEKKLHLENQKLATLKISNFEQVHFIMHE